MVWGYILVSARTIHGLAWLRMLFRKESKNMSGLISNGVALCLKNYHKKLAGGLSCPTLMAATWMSDATESDCFSRLAVEDTSHHGAGHVYGGGIVADGHGPRGAHHAQEVVIERWQRGEWWIRGQLQIGHGGGGGRHRCGNKGKTLHEILNSCYCSFDYACRVDIKCL